MEFNVSNALYDIAWRAERHHTFSSDDMKLVIAEITMLRRALVIYGDRAKMSNAADMALQQAIDRAFENATPPMSASQ